MKCSRKSTTCLASLAAASLVLLAAGSGAGAPAGAGNEADRVRIAIEEAVRARLGETAEVSIQDIRTKLAGDARGNLTATPASGARLDRDIRFSLSHAVPNGTANAGYAIAAVSASAAHLRAARPIRRGATIAPDDIEICARALGAVPLAALPSPEEAIGAKAVRDLGAGEVITAALVEPPLAVRSGDTVTMRVALGAIEVTARVVAQQNGSPGDVIRVVNRASRKTLKGRVVGPGTVEVIR